MKAIKDFLSSLLLLDLIKGFMLTGKYLFKPKITVQYPEERTPQSPRAFSRHARPAPL